MRKALLNTLGIVLRGKLKGRALKDLSQGELGGLHGAHQRFCSRMELEMIQKELDLRRSMRTRSRKFPREKIDQISDINSASKYADKMRDEVERKRIRGAVYINL